MIKELQVWYLSCNCFGDYGFLGAELHCIERSNRWLVVAYRRENEVTKESMSDCNSKKLYIDILIYQSI
jgi:hypothetical protein